MRRVGRKAGGPRAPRWPGRPPTLIRNCGVLRIFLPADADSTQHDPESQTTRCWIWHVFIGAVILSVEHGGPEMFYIVALDAVFNFINAYWRRAPHAIAF